MTQWPKNAERNKRIAEMLLSGESISNTAKTLHCGKATVSYWADKLNTRQLPRSEAVKERVRLNATAGAARAAARNVAEWSAARTKVIAKAKAEWPRVRKDPDTMAFLGLYWGEGFKRSHHIGVVNCDPGVIKFSCDWLIKRTSAPLQLLVRYYPEHDPKACGLFWEQLIPVVPKLVPKRWLGEKRICRATYGICTVLVADWQLRLKIMVWLDLWKSSITGKPTVADPNIPKQTMTNL